MRAGGRARARARRLRWGPALPARAATSTIGRSKLGAAVQCRLSEYPQVFPKGVYCLYSDAERSSCSYAVAQRGRITPLCCATEQGHSALRRGSDCSRYFTSWGDRGRFCNLPPSSAPARGVLMSHRQRCQCRNVASGHHYNQVLHSDSSATASGPEFLESGAMQLARRFAK